MTTADDDMDSFLYGSESNQQPNEENPKENDVDEDDDEDDDDDIEFVVEAQDEQQLEPTTDETKVGLPIPSHSDLNNAGNTNASNVNATANRPGVDINPMGQYEGKDIVDLDLDYDDKPWLKPGADITDYFNYGFDEMTWRAYAEKQKMLRDEVAQQKKMRMFDAIRPNIEYGFDVQAYPMAPGFQPPFPIPPPFMANRPPAPMTGEKRPREDDEQEDDSVVRVLSGPNKDGDQENKSGDQQQNPDDAQQQQSFMPMPPQGFPGMRPPFMGGHFGRPPMYPPHMMRPPMGDNMRPPMGLPPHMQMRPPFGQPYQASPHGMSPSHMSPSEDQSAAQDDPTYSPQSMTRETSGRDRDYERRDKRHRDRDRSRERKSRDTSRERSRSRERKRSRERDRDRRYKERSRSRDRSSRDYRDRKRHR